MHELSTVELSQLSVRSIYASRCHNKLDELAVVASVHSFDILYVTESWLSSNVDSSGLCGFQAPLGTLVGGGSAAVNTRAVSMWV